METVNIPIPFGGGWLDPSRTVIHAMAEYVVYNGRAYHAIEWLRIKGWSAHAFVTPSGTVIRSRGDNQVAWHAKAQGHNYKALGIEFLVPGAHDWVSFNKAIQQSYLTPQQYKAGVKFCREEWVEKKGILHFIEHSAIDPDKPDPGSGFPFDQFVGDIGVVYKP
jgi:N-acetyl-anhydromuramyl-L-alanine amidase AmpD